MLSCDVPLVCGAPCLAALAAADGEVDEKTEIRNNYVALVRPELLRAYARSKAVAVLAEDLGANADANAAAAAAANDSAREGKPDDVDGESGPAGACEGPPTLHIAAAFWMWWGRERHA